MGYTERLIDDIQYKEDILKRMDIDLRQWAYGDDFWYELKGRRDELFAIIAALKQELLTCDNTAMIEAFGKGLHDALRERYPAINYKTAVDRRNLSGAYTYHYIPPVTVSVFNPRNIQEYPVQSPMERLTVDILMWQNEAGKRYRVAYCDKIDTLVWSE